MTLCFLAIAIQGVIIAFVRKFQFRDFDVHREVGRRFLEGDYLYSNGLCYPYMPTAAMYFSPLALVDRSTGMAIRYSVAVACLCLAFWLMHRMTQNQTSQGMPSGFTLGVITSLLALQFLLIDFDDAGPHAILLGILIGAMYAVWRGHELLGGVLFGLSTALKVTPALFLPYFLLKRQWRLSGYMSVATLCWILLPATWMGPTDWWKHQLEWTEVSFGSLLSDRKALVIQNEDRVRNSGLQQTVMRYLVTYPEDHFLRKDDPGYVPVFNVKPAVARVAGVSLGLGLLAFFAWNARLPYRGPGDPHWLRECSAVLILALLLSPITWVQHLVWLVPGLYIIVVEAYRARPVEKVFWGLAVLYVLLSIVLNYEFLGKQNYALFLSWKPYTIVMLMVLFVLLTWRPCAQYGSTKNTRESSLNVRFNPRAVN